MIYAVLKQKNKDGGLTTADVLETEKNITLFFKNKKEKLKEKWAEPLKNRGTKEKDEYIVKACKEVTNPLSPILGAKFQAEHVILDCNYSIEVYGYGTTPVDALDDCIVNEGNLRLAAKA